MKFRFFDRRIILLLITFLIFLPQLHAQWPLGMAEEPLMGNMAGSSGSLLPLPMRQTDELQKILENTQSRLFNLYSDKSQERVDSDFGDLPPRGSSHYVDLKFQALIEEFQAETEETGTLNKSALDENEQADSDLITVFNTLLVTASQERSSNLPEPNSQVATENYLSSDMINHCPHGGEDNQENKDNKGAEGDNNLAAPMDSVEPAPDEPSASNQAATGQSAQHETAEKLETLKLSENYPFNFQTLSAFNDQLIDTFYNDYSYNIKKKSITNMSDAFNHLMDDADQELLLTSTILTFFANRQTQKEASEHGSAISIISGSVVEVTKETESARDEIPAKILVKMACRMLGKREGKLDQKHTDIDLSEPNDITKLPAGHYTFKHHPLGFIKNENKDGSTNYFIYPAGSHFFLTTESVDVVKKFIKTAVEFWGQTYQGVIQYRWVADPNSDEDIDRLVASEKAERFLIGAELTIKYTEVSRGHIMVELSEESDQETIKNAMDEILKVDGIIKLKTILTVINWIIYSVKKGNEIQVIRNIFIANIPGVNGGCISSNCE